MKLFYGIVLVLMVFVSACAPQSAPVAAPVQESEPEPQSEPEVDVDGTGAAVAPQEESTVNEVRALGTGAFDPAELTVSAGSSVTWINNAGTNMVIIIFKDGRAYMNSQKFDPGESFEQEFADAGEYKYWQNIAFSGDGGTITVS
jgi:plastocyanin